MAKPSHRGMWPGLEFAPAIGIFAGSAIVALALFLSWPDWVTLTGALVSASAGLWATIRGGFAQAEARAAITGAVTGGDSYCYVDPGAESLSPRGEMSLFIVAQGKDPLYDVQVRVVDLEQPRERLTTLQAGDVQLVGNMPPNTASFLKSHRLPDQDSQDFNVFIMARNGPITQRLRLRKIDGRWVAATRVFRGLGSSGPVIHERVDAEFPRMEDGGVEW